MLDPSLANPPPFTVVPGKRLQAALKLHPHTFQTARAWSREGSVHVSRLKVICKLPTWASGSSPVTPLGPCVPSASEMPAKEMAPARWTMVGTVHLPAAPCV